MRILARTVVSRYRPKIVAITGSIGKTSAKEAVVCVLQKKYRVGYSEENYNNEIGLPLVILGVKSPGKSLIGWLNVIRAWFRVMGDGVDYPQVLVLEMGVDRRGDMDYLLSIVTPDISVVTHVSESHMEFFGSLKAIAKEKGKIVSVLSPKGSAVLNADNAFVAAMASKTKASVTTYGFSAEANLKAFNDEQVVGENGRVETHFKIDYKENVMPLRLRMTAHRHHIYAALAALAVADTLKVNLVDAAAALELFPFGKGRGQLLPGIGGSVVIDDTYNASPVSVSASLTTLNALPATRRIAVLGDMLELGTSEEWGHRSLADVIIKGNLQKVYLVGKRMRFLSEELSSKGFDTDRVYQFSTPQEAGEVLRETVREGDVVLLKGSQGMRMEIAAEYIIADDTRQRLPRQSKKWKRTPFLMPE